MTRNTRVLLIVAAVAVAVGAAAVIGFGGDDKKGSSSTAASTAASGPQTATNQVPPPTPSVEIKGGKAVGGVQTISVHSGQRARFTVRSDKAYEIHLHGFDVAKDVPAGGAVTFDVKTDAPGIYEFEIEDTGTKIGQVKVEP